MTGSRTTYLRLLTILVLFATFTMLNYDAVVATHGDVLIRQWILTSICIAASVYVMRPAK